jgi:hypothetical protein
MRGGIASFRTRVHESSRPSAETTFIGSAQNCVRIEFVIR